MLHNCRNDNDVLISIVMPVFNSHNFLVESINSIIAQSLQNWELVCIDDGSSDISMAILKFYAALDARILIVRQENKGASIARNTGIEKAVGKYIAFMDAGDVYPSDDVFEKLLDAANKSGALIIGGGISFFDFKLNRSDLENKYSFKKCGWIDYFDYQQYEFYQRFIFDREMLIRNNSDYPSFQRYREPEFFVRSMLCSQRFFAVNFKTYAVRSGLRIDSWDSKEVSDKITKIKATLELSIDKNLNCIFNDLIDQSLKNADFIRTLESSLIDGNDEVVDFFKFIKECVAKHPVASVSKSEEHYLEIISSWDKKRNIRYKARNIEALNNSLDSVCISVIIPVYNTLPYLSDCINSVLRQKIEGLEIICIDDGSSDGSEKKLDEIAWADSRVKVFHQENQGQSVARNIGLQYAQGTYVFFMDSDDMLADDALLKLATEAEKKDADIVYFGANSFFDEDFPLCERDRCKLPMTYNRTQIPSECITGEEMFVLFNDRKVLHIPVWIQFFKADFIRQNHLAFFEGIIHEDNLFTLESILKAKRCCCINESLIQRRIRIGSTMTKPISYKNLLGYYLTYITLSEKIVDLKLSEKVKVMIEARLENMLKWHVLDQWDKLPRVDNILFLASLSKTDRSKFYGIKSTL